MDALLLERDECRQIYAFGELLMKESKHPDANTLRLEESPPSRGIAASVPVS
jgi:hypothetical protein